MRKLGFSLAVLIGAVAVAPTFAAISDDFEVDTSGNYSIMSDTNAPSGDGAFDGTVLFNFDYTTLGVPLAPNSSAGAVHGLVMTVNDTAEGDAGATTSTEEDHVTAFHTTNITDAAYRLTVDIFMGVDLGASGTTEMAHVGVAGDGLDFNSIFTPIAGSGHYISMTGEGGSSSDYRHSTPNTYAVPSGDLTYLNADNTTNATAQLYQDLFPSPPSDVAGSPTNIWTTLTIEVDPLNVTYFLDGVAIIRTPTEGNEGLVSLGYIDPFDSVGPNFVVYDNLTVEVIPEPASLALLGLGGLAMFRRR